MHTCVQKIHKNRHIYINAFTDLSHALPENSLKAMCKFELYDVRRFDLDNKKIESSNADKMRKNERERERERER